ncbi:hypothetical protein BDF20DRAFT_165875 [Mycotypha africana]|uniref:uncharacterized protein n=1 Tax=Mycotypha africana TaxID=64632 RepID=UPI002300A584|nr:uncharacterized protein BDF20DRAFT_165875 [Mycotypha africana]KAI8968188.1 hypothetical protein BDF20DRAFT_165875 [Mycotypha africana]
MDTKAAFPQNPKDPFCQPAAAEATISTSWWPSQNQQDGIAPRWKLLTSEEKQEQAKVINRLESKLKRIQKQKDNVYKYNPIPAMVDGTALTSEDEDDRGADETASWHSVGEIQEEQEGLPLLWKDKSMSFENAPRKAEKNFIPALLQWFYCYCCYSQP